MSENLLPEHPDDEARPPIRRRAARVALVGLTAVGVLSGGVGAWAYVFGVAEDGAEASSGRYAAALLVTTTTEPPTTTTTTRPAPTTTTTTIPEMERPEIVQMPPVPPAGLGPGGDHDTVLTYEYRLAGLHFDPGPVDGVYDQATAYAVTAVQKLYGFERTGRIGEQTRFALSVFEWPKRLVAENPEPDRVEIDLDRQVLVLWKQHSIELITTVSTGNGRRFCGGDQGCQYATTPPGRFEFTWHYNGWRKSKLGRLYNPYYFNGGIAVHGYASVPPYPASHGCTRIPMHIAEYFPDLVWKHMPVYVVGTPAGPYGAAPGGGGGGSPGPATSAPPASTATTTPPGTTATTAPGAASTTAPVTTTPTTAPATTAPTTAPATTAPTTAAPTTAAPTTSPPTSPPTTSPPPTEPPTSAPG